MPLSKTHAKLLKIRLARAGCRNHPVYMVNVAEAYRRRDGRFIENVGKYEPIPDPIDNYKHITLNFERIKYWLGKGAQPTWRVQWLLGKVPAGASIVPALEPCIYMYILIFGSVGTNSDMFLFLPGKRDPVDAQRACCHEKRTIAVRHRFPAGRSP